MTISHVFPCITAFVSGLFFGDDTKGNFLYLKKFSCLKFSRCSAVARSWISLLLIHAVQFIFEADNMTIWTYIR